MCVVTMRCPCDDHEAVVLRAYAAFAPDWDVVLHDTYDDLLETALVSVVRTTYRVEDEAGQVVARGVASDAEQALPAGTFRLVVESEPPVVVDRVEVRPGATTRVEVAREGGRTVGRVVGR